MSEQPLVSVCIPIHDMENGAFFLARLFTSLARQTYKRYEIVVTKDGKMAENTNSAMRKAKGDIIKILYMDDYFAHPEALSNMVVAFRVSGAKWSATGCEHDYGYGVANPHIPLWNDEIHTGKNTIGSPSVIALRNGLDMYFDENLSWLLDCDFYRRMKEKHGAPVLTPSINIVIGVGAHQTSAIMSDEEKKGEGEYIKQKYETN